ncbi:hypothetical protein OEZ86_004334 [Tetradesmus obliquus]|nr:hypothetical protein OEZ86_004334 [Tetradesmus obliquus]
MCIFKLRHLLVGFDLCLENQHGKALAEEIKSDINYRLQEIRGCHEAFYPSDGLEAKYAMAEERRGVMKFAAIAMYGLADDAVAQLFADYARWQKLRDLNTHAEGTLAALEQATDALINSINTTLGDCKSFDFPKMANMRKYAAVIPQMRIISISDTGPKESFNKGLSEAYNATNRKYKGLNQQVANRVPLTAALQQASARPASDPAKPAIGVRQTTAADWQPTMSPSGKMFNFANLTDINTWEYKVVDCVPELTHLQSAVTSMLSSTGTPLGPAGTLTSVEIKAALGLPRVEGIVDVVRGHAALTGRMSNCLTINDVCYDTIMVSPDGAEQEQQCYGQVYTLGTAADIDFVFVRCYANPADVNPKDSRGKPLGFAPLVWEPAAPKAPTAKKRVHIVQGSYMALTLGMLNIKVCIVPAYKLGGDNYLLNDLIS